MVVPVAYTVAVPSGGAVRIDMPNYALATASGISSMMLERSVSGTSTWTTLYSGSPVPVWIDCGDNLPGPLSSGSTYLYRLTDTGGTVTTSGVTPANTMIATPDTLTVLLIRLLQGGINNLAVPTVFAPAAQITTQMPQGGFSALPFVVVNLDLLQQAYTQVGRDSFTPDQSNTWTITSMASRTWRISVMGRSAAERDYYRDTILVLLQVVVATVFSYIGQTVENRFQAASGTDAREWEGKNPGFYYSDIIFEVTGAFNAKVTTALGYVTTANTGTTIGNVSPPIVDYVQLPLTL